MPGNGQAYPLDVHSRMTDESDQRVNQNQEIQCRPDVVTHVHTESYISSMYSTTLKTLLMMSLRTVMVGYTDVLVEYVFYCQRRCQRGRRGWERINSMLKRIHTFP